MKSPLITRSALVGKPTKNDIFNYLHSLKQNGIDEVMIYPRSGCLIEYLSEEWFLAIENFIMGAESLGMSIGFMMISTGHREMHVEELQKTKASA